jgi:hypothetical protein
MKKGITVTGKPLKDHLEALDHSQRLPPIAVRLKTSLNTSALYRSNRPGKAPEAFNFLLYKRLDATLEEYLNVLQEASN